MARYWKRCENCGREFQGARHAKTCGDACRKAKSRRPAMLQSLYRDTKGQIDDLIAAALNHPNEKAIILQYLNDLHEQIGAGCNAVFGADRRPL